MERQRVVQRMIGNSSSLCRHKRVEPWKVRRLYKLSAMGIYDDDLLMNVGWDLYARCEDVLLVCRAVGDGELPCPGCGGVIHRSKQRRHRASATNVAAAPTFACPSCRRRTTWQECREALRLYPICLDCSHPLRWRHEEDSLVCEGCGVRVEWRRYRQHIRTRTRLPCPHCHRTISRSKRDVASTPRPAVVDANDESYPCPRCRSDGLHEPGRFRCVECGHTERWEAFRRREKRRTERLACSACGLTFSWNQWRRHYQGKNLQMGNRPAVEAFVSRWPRCRDERAQLTLIDALIHALHARGSIAPALIRGSDSSVKRLLDGLAGVC